MREHDGVVRGQRLEFVGRGHEGQAGQRRDPLGDKLGKPRLGIEAGADRSAPLRQRIEMLERLRHALASRLHLRGVAGEFLPERQRGGILRVGTADLDDAGEFLALALKRRVQMRQRRQQALGDLGCGCDMHRGRKAVVRRLAHIDVVVGMHRRIGARLAAEHFVGARRNHFVHVHVGLGAGPGLPHDQRKVVVELAVDHFLGGAHDRPGAAGVERAELVIHLGGRPLDDGQRADQRDRHTLGPDAEIAERALGLRPPIAVGRHLDRAETVGLDARLLARFSHCRSRPRTVFDSARRIARLRRGGPHPLIPAGAGNQA